MVAPLNIDEDLETMLKFYHDLGRIIYFGHLSNDKSYLQDTVILNPQWLINVFKEIITIRSQEDMVKGENFVLLVLSLLDLIRHLNRVAEDNTIFLLTLADNKQIQHVCRPRG